MVLKTEKVMYIVRTVLRFFFVLANNLYCIPAHSFWMLILSPLLYWNPSVYWSIEGEIYKALLSMVAIWGWTAGYKYYEVGEDISSCYNQECLVMSNHQSTADVPTFMTVFQHKQNVVPRMMWIMDRLFKYTNFGLVSTIHGDFFIQAGKNTRSSELEKLKDHLHEVYIKRKMQWIVLYPEGGFLHKRKEVSQRYARKNNLPVFEHVSLPRVGALHTIVNTLHPTKLGTSSYHGNCNNFCNSVKKEKGLRWIIDATIGYPYGNVPDLLSIALMVGKPCDVYIYYRRFPIEEVPTEVEQLTKWLYDRFTEKEELLSEFYRTGSFPNRPSPHSRLVQSPHLIEFDNQSIIISHVLFILSTLIHYWLLSWLFTLLWYILVGN